MDYGVLGNNGYALWMQHNVEVSCGPDGCRACTGFYDETPHDTPACPAKLVKAKQGQLHWFVKAKFHTDRTIHIPNLVKAFAVLQSFS